MARKVFAAQNVRNICRHPRYWSNTCAHMQNPNLKNSAAIFVTLHVQQVLGSGIIWKTTREKHNHLHVEYQVCEFLQSFSLFPTSNWNQIFEFYFWWVTCTLLSTQLEKLICLCKSCWNIPKFCWFVLQYFEQVWNKGSNRYWLTFDTIKTNIC